MPAIFFRYELSPIRIQYTMSMMTVTQFMVKVCAIVGGVYACSSIFESVLRNSISILGFGSTDQQAHEYGQGLKRRGPPTDSVADEQSYDKVAAHTEESIEMSGKNL